MRVQQILDQKGRNVFSIHSSATVYEALQIMSEKNIGALPVMDDDQLKGIFSERDYARKVVLQNKASKDTAIHEIMTHNVITVNPYNSIDECMELMSNKHIRHLPVEDKGKVVGILSISDIVTSIISMQKETIDHLQSYIAS